MEKPEELVESIDFGEVSLEQFLSKGGEESTRQAPREPMPIEQCELHSVHILKIMFINISPQLRKSKLDFRNFIPPSLCVRPSSLRRAVIKYIDHYV